MLGNKYFLDLYVYMPTWSILLIVFEYYFGTMQARNQKDANEARFQDIDNRWSAVQDAFKIEEIERSQDLYILKEQLQQRTTKVTTIEEKKGEILGNTLRKILANAEQSKENIEYLFETQAEFRIQHLDKKNQFIQNYLDEGNATNSTLQQYATNKIKDICDKLESIHNANVARTQEAVKQIQQEHIGEAQVSFEKEKEKYTQLFGKISDDSNRTMEQFRDLLKAKRKQREENEAKLKIMIANLVEELSKMSESEAKEGEMTYDCLLKLLEECCAKIQEAQLR